jgi:uncharacterized protein (DUF433 family)
MAKKTARTPERLESIEARLLRVEELLSHSESVATSWALFWSRHFGFSRGFPLLLPPALFGMPAEIKEKRRQMRESPVEPWTHLVRRHHPWRKQLYLQGRNLTARQLVGSMTANELAEDKAAANYQLPVEAIREAVAYVERNKELLETESEIERLMLKRGEGGVARGPQPVA